MDLLWITKAEYVSDFKIKLSFNNGFIGIVNLKDSLNAKIFQPLRDKKYFKTFKQNSWTIEWDCNVDFAPEYLYNLANNQSPQH